MRAGSGARAGAHLVEHTNVGLLAYSLYAAHRRTGRVTGLAEREGMAPVTGGTAFEVSGVTQQAACSVPSCEGDCWGEAVRCTRCRLVIRCEMWTRGACGVTLGAAPHYRRHLHCRAQRGFSKFCVVRRGCVCILARGTQAGAPSSAATPTNLDRAESIGGVPRKPSVSCWVELEVTMKLPADRDFFPNVEPSGVNLPPIAHQYAGFIHFNAQSSCEKRPPILHILDPQVN